MADMIKLEDHLDLPERYFVSKAFMLYWWIKRKAVDVKRIKSCRAMKVMKPSTVDDIHVAAIVEALEIAAFKEHAKNLKHILENTSYISDNFAEVSLDSRRGRIRLVCDYNLTKMNSALRFIYRNSNIPQDRLKELFFVDGNNSSFSFYYSNQALADRMRNDYSSIAPFAQKVKDTVTLAERIYSYFGSSIEDYEWFAPSREDLSINFTGVDGNSFTVSDILNSEVVISIKGKENTVIPGESLPEAQRVRRLSAQDRLNQYIQNVIIPRRRDAD